MSDTLQYSYDAEADVLYVSKGDPRADADSDEVEEGIVARFDPATREVVGFTILNVIVLIRPGKRVKDQDLAGAFDRYVRGFKTRIVAHIEVAENGPITAHGIHTNKVAPLSIKRRKLVISIDNQNIADIKLAIGRWENIY